VSRRKALARGTGYSKERIERGIKGEKVPISQEFIRTTVMTLGLISGRAKAERATVDRMSYDDCIRLIEPVPAMPDGEIDFWHKDK